MSDHPRVVSLAQAASVKATTAVSVTIVLLTDGRLLLTRPTVGTLEDRLLGNRVMDGGARTLERRGERAGEWVNDNVYENAIESVFERVWAKRHVRYIDKETGRILDRDTLRIDVSKI